MEDVKWSRSLFDAYPEWTSDPDTEGITRAIQESGIICCSGVRHLADGAFHKVYDIQRSNNGPASSARDLVIRVALPVEPRWKTLSEVATMHWVRANTSLPVPEVMAYKSDRSDPAEFEWILMTKMPGRPLADVWSSMEWTAKERLVAQFAQYTATTFRKQFTGIGNIYPDAAFDTRGQPELGRIVAMEFFWNQRGLQDVARGPFRSSWDWLAARLQVREVEWKDRLVKYAGVEFDSDAEDGDPEAEYDEAKRGHPVIKKAQAHLGDVFRQQLDDEEAEASILWHDDLSQYNILVDDGGTLTGVIDWECASAIPLWSACRPPKFLDSVNREDKPEKSDFAVEEDGTPNQMYFERLEEWEQTRLRAYFFEQMRLLEPKWVEVYEASEVKREFENCIQMCDSFCNKIWRDNISDWLDSLSTGNPKSMDEIAEESERLHMERMIEDAHRREREYREARQAEAQTSTQT